MEISDERGTIRQSNKKKLDFFNRKKTQLMEKKDISKIWSVAHIHIVKTSVAPYQFILFMEGPYIYIVSEYFKYARTKGRPRTPAARPNLKNL